MNSNVWLTRNHHNFPDLEEGICLAQKNRFAHIVKTRKYTPLTKNLLDRSYLGYNGSLVKERGWINCYSSALRALASLDGCISFVSLGITTNEKDRMFTSSKRDWAEIYLASTSECIMRFSQDTRKDGHLFESLMEWVEEDWEGDNLMEGVKKWSTVEIWKAFFISRIQNVAAQLEDNALNLQAETQLLKERADRFKKLLKPA